jgi:hypothetical protein
MLLEKSDNSPPTLATHDAEGVSLLSESVPMDNIDYIATGYNVYLGSPRFIS